MSKVVDSLDQVFHALADPTRRALLKAIGEGVNGVCDLAAAHPVSLNTISKHLKVLERSGLVARTKKGREMHFTLRPVALEDAEALIVFYRNFWTRALQRAAEELSAIHAGENESEGKV